MMSSARRACPTSSRWPGRCGGRAAWTGPRGGGRLVQPMNETILLVDDELLLRTFARDALQAFGYKRGQRVVVEGRAHACAEADDPPMAGGSGPLPPENRRRMRSRIAGNSIVVITCLLTNTSAPLSEAMSR